MKTYKTTKRVLAEKYVELRKEFDGEYFRPCLTQFNIDWLVEKFSIEHLNWKIECVRNAIQAKKERLADEGKL